MHDMPQAGPRLMLYMLHVICTTAVGTRLQCDVANKHIVYMYMPKHTHVICTHARACMQACTHTWQQLLISLLTHLRYALGLNPSSLALSSLISKQAEAPSVCNSREGGERERERKSTPFRMLHQM